MSGKYQTIKKEKLRLSSKLNYIFAAAYSISRKRFYAFIDEYVEYTRYGYQGRILIPTLFRFYFIKQFLSPHFLFLIKPPKGNSLLFWVKKKSLLKNKFQLLITETL